MVVVQRQAIAFPQARLLPTRVYPRGAEAVDIVFFPLNCLDHVHLFHSERLNVHTFGHPLNLLKSHFALPSVVLSLIMA
jgi:hypothetical protein